MTVERAGNSLACKLGRFFALWEVCDVVRVVMDANNKPQPEVDCEHDLLAHWSGQELSVLCDAFAEHGQQWTLLSDLVPVRSRSAVKMQMTRLIRISTEIEPYAFADNPPALNVEMDWISGALAPGASKRAVRAAQAQAAQAVPTAHTA